ncbi:hypothetical protein CDN97_21820 [Pantoea sp. AMG 501]|nr:hypothetical protein CDN97_21820 [Pantoea sp. AMG 501]
MQLTGINLCQLMGITQRLRAERSIPVLTGASDVAIIGSKHSYEVFEDEQKPPAVSGKLN